VVQLQNLDSLFLSGLRGFSLRSWRLEAFNRKVRQGFEQREQRNLPDKLKLQHYTFVPIDGGPLFVLISEYTGKEVVG
jgi:hypothetical protein